MIVDVKDSDVNKVKNLSTGKIISFNELLSSYAMGPAFGHYYDFDDVADTVDGSGYNVNALSDVKKAELMELLGSTVDVYGEIYDEIITALDTLGVECVV